MPERIGKWCELAYFPPLWQNTTQHLNGAAAAMHERASNGVVTPAGCDPFDGFVLTHRRRAGSAEQPPAVHPDGGELHAVRRTGDCKPGSKS